MHLELRQYRQSVVRELHPPISGLAKLVARASQQADTFPLLSGVDPQGVTTFNSFQCRRLVTELTSLSARGLSDDEEEALRQVREVVTLLAGGHGKFPDPADLEVSFVAFVYNSVLSAVPAGVAARERVESAKT